MNEIKTGVCVSCLYEYLISIKERLNEEEEKHMDCIKALKDLLLDSSRPKDIKKIEDIVDSGVVKSEEKELKEKSVSLFKKRKELEENLEDKKDVYKKLKAEENDILFKLNENERIKEEQKKYKEKLILKKQYLQKYYEKVIKEN